MEEKMETRVSDLMDNIHQWSLAAGTWKNQRPQDKLIHAIEEICEAGRYLREGKAVEATTYIEGKPEGFSIELADAILMLFDVAEHLNIDLESAIEMKAAWLEHREPHLSPLSDAEKSLHRRGVTVIDGIFIDWDRAEITGRDGVKIRLTKTEYKVLRFLFNNSGRVMENRDILTHCWGPEYVDDLQYLRVWVSRLRQKMERDPSNPRIIRTIQGYGYIFDDERKDQPVEAAAVPSPV